MAAPAFAQETREPPPTTAESALLTSQRRRQLTPTGADVRVRRRLLVIAAVAVAGCSRSPGQSNAATKGTAATVTQQLASRNITVKGSIICHGIAPGVIDCTGTTHDGKEIVATLNATTGGANCGGPLIITVGGTHLATITDAKCS